MALSPQACPRPAATQPGGTQFIHERGEAYERVIRLQNVSLGGLHCVARSVVGFRAHSPVEARAPCRRYNQPFWTL